MVTRPYTVRVRAQDRTAHFSRWRTRPDRPLLLPRDRASGRPSVRGAHGPSADRGGAGGVYPPGRKRETTRSENPVYGHTGLRGGVPEALVEDGHEICGVFTQPDRPKNRGHKLAFSPVKEYALSQGLTVYQPTKMRDGTALALVRELHPS